MPKYTNWEMLVPQPPNVVHNLIRNPSFEYNSQFFAGVHQYWWYYDSAGTKVSSGAAYPTQTGTWSSYGRNGLSLALDGTTFRHAEYWPRVAAFENLNTTLSVTLTAPDAPTGGNYTATTYPAGTHYACAFLLSPYGGSLASTSDVLPQESGSAPQIELIQPEGYNVVDLMRGHSRPFFSSGLSYTAGTGRILATISLPSGITGEYPGRSCGIALFWSRPSDTHPVTGARAWRCVYVRPSFVTGSNMTFYLPEYSASQPNNWERGSTVFYTNTSPTFNTFTIMQENGASIDAAYIGIDSSQPSFAITPSGTPWNIGTTYSHHFYLDWFIDTNYNASTSPFIACGCDYAVTFIDNLTGATYTPVNPDTGDNRLAALPTNRAEATRTGRTKFLLTPPNNSVNTNAGLDIRLRISIVSPTGTYTGNAAVLYIDALQFVDIRYRGSDDLDWDDVEFTYLDGDVAGAEWEDFAPSYTSIAGTATNGIYPASIWLGTTNAGWGSSFSMPNRDLLLSGDSVTVNTYGGTSYQGYSQSAMKTFSSEVGTYYPIDADHLGASVNVTTTGVGMPEIMTVTQPYGIVDGGLVQRQVTNMRTMQLSIDIIGSSQANLHDRRRKLINALKFDQLAQQGDRVIRYSGSNTPVIYRVTYTAGLEFTGNVGVSFTEAASVQFICGDPYVYSERPIGTRLPLNSDLYDLRTYMAYKQGDNQPWVYTGMKEYSDYYQGNGTITNSTNSLTAQGANGTLTCTITANTTLTISSTTVTAGAAFFFGNSDDVGRTVYARVGAGNIFVVGVIGTASSTTVAFLNAAPIGGNATYAAGNWWVSNRIATISIGTLASNRVGNYLVIGIAGNVLYHVLGKISAVSAGRIELSTYYVGAQAFGSIPNVAVAANAWYTVGYTSSGTVGTMTGVGSALVTQNAGMNLYWQTTRVNPLGKLVTVTNPTTATMDTDVLCPGTISIPASNAGSGTVTGSGTLFSSIDVGKLMITEDGQPLGVISSVTSSTSATLNTTLSGYPFAVPAGTKFRLVHRGAIGATSYWLETAPLNWSGGYFKYHMGFIASPVSNSVAILVGGFDNGRPAIGYGMSQYMAIIDMDAKQNTTGGSYSTGVPTSRRNLTNNATDGFITCSTGSAIVTTNQAYTFWPSDVNIDLWQTATPTGYIGRIKSWDSPTQVTLWANAGVNISNKEAFKVINNNVLNSSFSSVRPLMNRMMTRAANDGLNAYYTLVATGPITAIYQETPNSVLMAGSFSGYSDTGGAAITDIKLVRVRGYMQRQGTTETTGAVYSTEQNVLDVEVVATNATAGWGTPQIHCITTDPLGNIYVGGENFTTSHVWFIGRSTDGTFTQTYTPLGAYVAAPVIALVTDTKFPNVNIYAAITTANYLKVFPFFNPRSSAGTWYDPSSMTVLGNFYNQAPNNIIYGFLRTQAGDILVFGAFEYWGATYVNGLARFVPRIGSSAADVPAVVTPAVPVAGSFAQPGIAGIADFGSYVGTMADVSYNTTTSSYAGTGERIAFGGSFVDYEDGRVSLSLGYLEGSGAASSVRRMITSDLGLEPPAASENYPVIQKIASTTRNRLYYSNNQVAKTDNLVGPTYAVLMTQNDGGNFRTGSPIFRTGYGTYSSSNNVAIPQMTTVTVNVRGNANAYPIFTFTLPNGTSIYELVQTETGAHIRFDDLYGLRGIPSGRAEVITLDTRPGYRSVTSNIRGSLMQFTSPESNFGDFYLLAPFTSGVNLDVTRPNTLVLRYSVVNAVSPNKYLPTIDITYTPRFWSFDAAPLYKDAPDTPLM